MGVLVKNWHQPPGLHRLAFGDRWLLLTGEERALIDRLYGYCKRLDDPAHTSNIFVGLQTSADAIYHLRRIGPRRYLCAPKGDNAPPLYEVEIEDALMKPLISGADAKRYVEPTTDTYLLFPYQLNSGGVRLIDATTMQATYPKAWAYLTSYRDDLRLREAQHDRHGNVTRAPFDDEQWYRFGRHQNLDKQEIIKLVVPRLVARLACSVDQTGTAGRRQKARMGQAILQFVGLRTQRDLLAEAPAISRRRCLPAFSGDAISPTTWRGRAAASA